MKDQSRKPSLWEALLAAGRKNQKKRVTPVTPVTCSPTTRNHDKFTVTSHGSKAVTHGLQALLALDAVAPTARTNCCMGLLCATLDSGGQAMCRGSQKAVNDLLKNHGRCPEGKWRRFGGYASSPETVGKCRVCGGDSWWRTKSMDSWICGNCHPPIVPQSQCVFTGQDLAGETVQ